MEFHWTTDRLNGQRSHLKYTLWSKALKIECQLIINECVVDNYLLTINLFWKRTRLLLFRFLLNILIVMWHVTWNWQIGLKAVYGESVKLSTVCSLLTGNTISPKQINVWFQIRTPNCLTECVFQIYARAYLHCTVGRHSDESVYVIDNRGWNADF